MTGVRNRIGLVVVLFLILIPAVVADGCYLFHIHGIAAGISVVLAAMPAGTSTAILAAKYHGDEAFATQCVVVTTLLSMLMLPLWCLILNGML